LQGFCIPTAKAGGLPPLHPFSVNCQNLHEAKGLETIQHRGLSSLDVATLRSSVHDLPDAFLMDVGYSEAEIHSWRTMYPYPTGILELPDTA
jgi:hypothetical protein